MRILCLGDSNTYGFDPRSYFGDRYPPESRWTDLLAGRTGWTVLNAGANGREIPRRSWELRQFGRMLSECGPLDVLAVMLGSNDLLQGAAAAEAAARMEDFLTQLPLEREKMLLIAPPPMQPGAWVTEKQVLDASSELTELYRALAERLGTRFAAAERWKIDLTFDGVHFSEAGHRAFADGIYAELAHMAAKAAASEQ